jgi:predicted RNase H-like HicB family nuclease
MKITIKQVMIDGERLYEANCNRFPYLTEYADTYEEAESLIRDAIEVTMEYWMREGNKKLTISSDH